jgi:hypothetical protein
MGTLAPKLEEECGVTRVSLHNARELDRVFGRPVEVVLQADGHVGECAVWAFYQNGERHDFTGFGWSYRGEGPHGLYEFLRGLGFNVSMDTIAGWPTKTFGKRLTVADGGTLS